MISYLSKYFYVLRVIPNHDQSIVNRLVGYFTDESHMMFLPPQEITREEAIKMLDSGIALFSNTNTGQRILLRKVEKLGKIHISIE